MRDDQSTAVPNGATDEGTAPISQNIQSIGGKARAKKLTPEERSEIAQFAAETRWENAGGLVTSKAIYDGTLKIGHMELPCAVLEDGTRVISSRGMMRALGRPWKGTYRVDARPNFLAGSNLEPYISEELRAELMPLEFRTRKGGYARGYRAELLPTICEVYLAARDAGNVLTPMQKGVAKTADIVMRALAHVGIIALVDEATGYQEVRDRLALQEVLRKYITGALFEWTKTFPLEFYRQIFRLKGWEWKDGKMPSVVGRYTNDLVYNRLTSGLLEELRRHNPMTDKGYRRHKHHQYLTRDLEHPALSHRLYELIGMARASETWDRFYRLVDRTFPKLNATLALPLDD